jgi:hypothetical protein
METYSQRALMLTIAEDAVSSEELERAIVALAEYEADHPGDVEVRVLHERLTGQFAAAAPPLDQRSDGWAEWRLRAALRTEA